MTDTETIAVETARKAEIDYRAMRDHAAKLAVDYRALRDHAADLAVENDRLRAVAAAAQNWRASNASRGFKATVTAANARYRLLKALDELDEPR